MQFYGTLTHGGQIIPASKHDAELVEQKLTAGKTYLITPKNQRNIKFHRKFFAMLDLAFDAWEPQPISEKYQKYGMPAKDKERFRAEVLILAGHCTPVYSMKGGEVRFEAKSISFSSCDEIKFEEIYSKVADVILSTILKNYTRNDLDNVVDQMMGFV